MQKRTQRARDLIHAALRKVNVAVLPYQLTPQPRRVKLIRYAGCEHLIDVGANVGQWASDSRAAGWDGPIRSLEPVSVAFAKLERRARRDAGWQVRRVAVGAKPGSAEINVSEDTVYSSLAPVTQAAT